MEERVMARTITTVAAAVCLTIGAMQAAAQQATVVIKIDQPAAKPPEAAHPPFDGKRPAVDVAILLDTSNSMDGLINQAKSQLWAIVGQFAKARRNGLTPLLRVALFEYGNTRLPAADGYIRQVVPLTDDLDKFSEHLFALRTQGGDEYCGQVIDEAVTRLDWSKEPNSYKAVFIAGNEPFTQGPVDYKAACKRAIERGIIVNTIHCGNSRAGVSGMWQDGARLAEGRSLNIDQDRAVVHIKAPQDEIIIRLNADLNDTYLWYGATDVRRYHADNQIAQDNNSINAGNSSTRIAVKAGGMYFNRGRDLVDTYREDNTILARVKDEELPEAMQKLSPAQREAFVQQMTAKRAEVQKKIAAAAAEREAYIAGEQNRVAAASGEATLGGAVISSVLDQLQASGFEIAAKAQ
jgi:hypothetical protein